MDRRYYKQKMSAALWFLLLCAAALGGMTLAWITLSTNPEISHVKANLTVNQNLEIALDDGYADALAVDEASVTSGDTAGDDPVAGSVAGDPYTWGNYLDLTKAFSNEELNLSLTQVKFNLENTESPMEYALYDIDGRMESTAPCAGVFLSDYEGKGEEGGITVFGPPETERYYAFSVTYWLRSNMDGNVTLTPAAKRADDGSETEEGVNGVTGGGCYIRVPEEGNTLSEALDRFMGFVRVAFVDETEDSPTLLFEAGIAPAEADGDYHVYELFMPGGSAESASGEPLYEGSEAEGGGTEGIALTAYEAKKITMYVYIDGEKISNNEALLYNVTGVEINVQFDHSAIAEDETGGAMTGDTTTNSRYEDGVTTD